MTVKVIIAHFDKDIASVKQLFLDYATALPIDLDFQGFDSEMTTFPNKYKLLLLAKQDKKPVGAVGLLEHDTYTCEMKRLFVSPETQSKGAGRLLCKRLMLEAQKLGYKTMVLDTLARLKPAVKLYRSLGFTETSPYNVNAEPDVIYMSIELHA